PRRSNAVLLLDGTLQRAKLDVVATFLVRAELEEAGCRSVLANRHAIEVNRESRPAKPITRRVTAESIDLEIRTHLECRRIDDAAQASHDRALGGEHVLHVLLTRRGLNADRLLAVWVGDPERQHAAAIGPSAQP